MKPIYKRRIKWKTATIQVKKGEKKQKKQKRFQFLLDVQMLPAELHFHYNQSRAGECYEPHHLHLGMGEALLITYMFSLKKVIIFLSRKDH